MNLIAKRCLAFVICVLWMWAGIAVCISIDRGEFGGPPLDLVLCVWVISVLVLVGISFYLIEKKK